MNEGSSLGVQDSLIGALLHACLLSWKPFFWAQWGGAQDWAEGI